MMDKPIPEPMRIPHPPNRGKTSRAYLSAFSGVMITISYLVLFLGIAILILLSGSTPAWVGILIILSGAALLSLERSIGKQLRKTVDDERGNELREHIVRYMALLRPGSVPEDPEGWIDNTKRTEPPSPVFQPIYVFSAVVDDETVTTKAYLMANYIFLAFSRGDGGGRDSDTPGGNRSGESYEISVPPSSNLGRAARLTSALGTLLSGIVFVCVSITVMLNDKYDYTLATCLGVALLSALPFLFSLVISYILRRLHGINESERRAQIAELVSFGLANEGIKAPVLDPEDMTSKNALGGIETWLPLVALAPDGEQCQVDVIPKGRRKMVLKVGELIFE